MTNKDFLCIKCKKNKRYYYNGRWNIYCENCLKKIKSTLNDDEKGRLKKLWNI